MYIHLDVKADFQCIYETGQTQQRRRDHGLEDIGTRAALQEDEHGLLRCGRRPEDFDARELRERIYKGYPQEGQTVRRHSELVVRSPLEGACGQAMRAGNELQVADHPSESTGLYPLLLLLFAVT